MESSNTEYYKLTKDKVLEVFRSSEDGLSGNEAAKRLKESGPNRIEEKKQKSLFRLLLEQINNPVIYLLFGAVAVSFIFHDIPEAIAIIVVIILNTMIGFWMEYKAQTSVNALKKLNKLKSRVKRDNVTKEINADQIVPGDILSLEAGDVIPADARVLFARELKVDESPLTGESFPVDKNADKLDRETPLAGRTNMLYKGTAVTNGKANALVCATGNETEIGSISEMVSKSDKEEIPLNRKLQKLSTHLIWVTVGLAALFFIFGWIVGKEIYLLLQTAIAWTVAAIPEGLPIVASIALARGMIRLSKRNVIVKKLAAAETLGETTVIFTDKTGTLTENKLTVNRIETPGNSIDTSVFDKKDTSTNSKRKILNTEGFRHILKVSVLCNDAEKVENRFKGDPLDVSLLEFANKANKKETEKLKQITRLHEDPFDSDSMFMGTINKSNGNLYVAAKGAVETMLSRSDYYLENGEKRNMSEDFKEKWLKQNDKLSAKGFKVIACTFRDDKAKDEKQLTEQDDFIHNMIFIGIICFIDPAKNNVTSAIETCNKAGINVVMITGDHSGTAQNIAEKVKIQQPGDTEVMKGDEMNNNPEAIYDANLFARVDPKQKLKIVESFKDKGEITAMTGDGVNDAPALKKADIGIAMGKRGTQLAREVADMILNDDSFPSIVKAVEEGRIIFENIRKFIIYQLSYHLAEIIIIAGISFTLFYIPLLPLQLLFLNLLSDVFPALALGLGKGNKNVMSKKPKNPKEPIINKRNWITTGIYGLIMAAVISGVYISTLFVFNQSKELANTIAFFGLAFAQLLHVFNMREPEEHLVFNQVTQNKYVWIALLVCIVALFTAYSAPVLNNVLSLSYLSFKEWMLAAGSGITVLIVTQIVKNIFKI